MSAEQGTSVVAAPYELFEMYSGDGVLIEETAAEVDMPRLRVEFGPIGERNLNNRLYPLDVAKTAVAEADKKAKVGRLVGFSDHPYFGPGEPEKVAVKYDSAAIDGKRVVLTGNVLPTDAGKNLLALIRSGVSMHVSPRGYGRAEWVVTNRSAREGEDEGYYRVIEWEITSVDFVMEGANRIQKVVEEKLEVMRRNGIISTVDESGSDDTVDIVVDNDDNDDNDYNNIMSDREWSREYINNLPDAAFAGIEPGGHKDSEGKTVPRRLRRLPHHNMKVKDPDEHDTVDIPHLRNALARAPQMKGVTEEFRRKCIEHLRRHAKALGVGDYDDESIQSAIESPIEEGSTMVNSNAVDKENAVDKASALMNDRAADNKDSTVVNGNDANSGEKGGDTGMDDKAKAIPREVVTAVSTPADNEPACQAPPVGHVVADSQLVSDGAFAAGGAKNANVVAPQTATKDTVVPEAILRAQAILEAKAMEVVKESTLKKYPAALHEAINNSLRECATLRDLEDRVAMLTPLWDGIVGIMPQGKGEVHEPEEVKQDGLFDTEEQVIEHYTNKLSGPDWLVDYKRRTFRAMLQNYGKSLDRCDAAVIKCHTRSGRAALRTLMDAGLSTDLVLVPQLLPIATRAWDKVVGQELVSVFPLKLPVAKVPKLDVVFEAGGEPFTEYLDEQLAGPVAEGGQKPLVKIKMGEADVVMEKKAVDMLWTLEQDQDYLAQYGLSVEETLVNATATRLALEIDLAIVSAIEAAAVASGNGLTFGTNPPSGVSKADWLDIGWAQYVSTIRQMVRDACHLETNFVICGTSAARLWEQSKNLVQPAAAVPASFREADFGALFMGYTMDGMRIYTTPQLTPNRMVFGVRSFQPNVYGVAFCPYVPLYITDKVTIPRTNQYEKAIGTRFGIATANVKFYGYIDVNVGGSGTWLL